MNTINGAMSWNSGNAYLPSFHNVDAGKACAVVVNSGFAPGTVPANLASPDGKFYLGPYAVTGVGQAYAVYDAAPTIVNGWTEPAGATAHVATTDAPLDAQSVVFQDGEWTVTVPKAPVVSVMDTIAKVTKTLKHGDSYCVGDPGDYHSVALSVTFADLSHVSVQRAQDVETWSAVDESCTAFNAAKVHMGGMTDADCRQITKGSHPQYGAPLVPYQTWGDAGASTSLPGSDMELAVRTGCDPSCCKSEWVPCCYNPQHCTYSPGQYPGAAAAAAKAAAGMDQTSPSSTTGVGPCVKNPDGGMDC